MRQKRPIEPFGRATRLKPEPWLQDKASSSQFNEEEPIELAAATNQIAMFAFARLATSATQLKRPLLFNSLVICLLAVCCPVASANNSNNNELIESAPTFSAFSASDSLPQAGISLPLIFAGQQQLASSGEKPRLIPLVAADSGYSENSSVNVLCTVSQGHHETLNFEWFKDGQPIQDANQQQQVSNFFELPKAATSLQAAPQIEKHQDHSLLRISKVQAHHAGRYSCAAKNQFGQDSSSLNLVVNVKMQWIKEPPKEVVVSLNQELKVECLAQGEPRPSMRWEKLDSTGHTTFSSTSPSKERKQAAHHANGHMDHSASSTRNQLASNFNGNKLSSHHRADLASGPSSSTSQSGSTLVSSTRYLTLTRARESDSGVYECVASNGHDHDLRKLVHVQVRGPPKILPIATADSYPEGSSINLICTVSGGQRRGLELSWTFNGEEMQHESTKRLKDLDSFSNIDISHDRVDISILRIDNSTLKNSGQYACTARNPLGQDSTSVKININVEMKWTKTPKEQIEVGINQELKLECDAQGSPQPSIEWLKHSDKTEPVDGNATRIVSHGKQLKISRAHHRDSGLYECVARNGAQENLRKFVHIKIRGK